MADRLSQRPYPSHTLPHDLEKPPGSPHPCRPGLEPSHTSLHPWQEEAAEALAGDAGTQAAVQGEQGLGASLGPVLLQLLPAQLPQQDLGAEERVPRVGGQGPPCPSPEASASLLPAGQLILVGSPDPCHPGPLHNRPEGHPLPSLSRNVPLPSRPRLPLCTHKHLGGSEVTEGGLGPQHLTQDGATPLAVRGLSLPLCLQGPEPAPRREKLRSEQAQRGPPSTLVRAPSP